MTALVERSRKPVGIHPRRRLFALHLCIQRTGNCFSPGWTGPSEGKEPVHSDD